MQRHTAGLLLNSCSRVTNELAKALLPSLGVGRPKPVTSFLCNGSFCTALLISAVSHSVL